jgi:hypothetical protein
MSAPSDVSFRPSTDAAQPGSSEGGLSKSIAPSTGADHQHDRMDAPPAQPEDESYDGQSDWGDDDEPSTLEEQVGQEMELDSRIRIVGLD